MFTRVGGALCIVRLCGRKLGNGCGRSAVYRQVCLLSRLPLADNESKRSSNKEKDRQSVRRQKPSAIFGGFALCII